MTMVYYKDYSNVMLSVIRSNNDMRIFLHIQDSFTKTKVDVNLNQTKIAKKLKCSLSSVKTIMAKLRTLQFIAKSSDGSYRLNPFIYIPYQSKGLELQEEWSEMHIDSQRGLEINHGLSENEANDLKDILS